MRNKDCTVLVTSCDAYQDVERPFIAPFRKYWPDCPFELVLVTETADCPDSEANRDAPRFDRIHATGKGKNWCQMLAEALTQIETPYVLLLMNDYLLTSPVDTLGFQRRLAQAKMFDAANLRLNPNPKGRISWRGSDLLEYPKNTAYCVTCQTGIWNKSYLMKLADQNRSAWEFERLGSFMVGDEPRPLLVTREKEFPFIDAVHKGYWEEAGIELCRRNGIPIDFTARLRQPLHVKAREGFKSLIFAVFPWTLVVRIQNLFNIGMKEKPVRGSDRKPSIGKGRGQ